MVHQGRKASARSPKGIRVSKRISKRVKKSLKEEEENLVKKCLDFASDPASDPVSACAEPEAEPMEQPDLCGDAEPTVITDPSDDETKQVIAEEEEEDPATTAVLQSEGEIDDEEDTEQEKTEVRELTDDEKIAASKQDLIEFFESSSFALAMQARLLAKKPDHELNFGCLLLTLAAGSTLPRSVTDHITTVWKKDNKWIRAWLENELCDPTESETNDEIPDAEAGLIDFYASLPEDAKEAATALSEKPNAEFNFGLMCSTLASTPLPSEVSKSLAMKWKTDQGWIREWLAGKLASA